MFFCVLLCSFVLSLIVLVTPTVNCSCSDVFCWFSVFSFWFLLGTRVHLLPRTEAKPRRHERMRFGWMEPGEVNGVWLRIVRHAMVLVLRNARANVAVLSLMSKHTHTQ